GGLEPPRTVGGSKPTAETKQPVNKAAVETGARPRVLRIGDIEIVVEGHAGTKAEGRQLPLTIPRNPEFWQAQYKEKQRRRREAEGQKEAAAAPKAKPTSWAALLRTGESAGSGAVGGQRYKTLGEALSQWRMGRVSAVQPRGLVNTGNMCFMNVVLQALVHCGAFRSVLWSVKENVAMRVGATGTGLLEALIRFVDEFRRDGRRLAELDELDDPFVPEDVYEALRMKGVFQTLRGQQEDAQEFMGYLVDGLHEEMATALQKKQLKDEAAVRREKPAGDDGGGWLEVGPGNRATEMRDTDAAADKTPITQIFGGTLRSTLTVAGAGAGGKLRRATREPFQWLALDVSADGVDTIEEALDNLGATETIEGYMDMQGTPAVATKQTVLERLPPVLVLHLKRFVFCADAGVQKVHKFIEYPPELGLAAGSRYRLTAVIYHHGTAASGGHYTCDIQRVGDEWLRFDDIDITDLSGVDAALEEKDDRAAYILFYTAT
ncbi:hypothetical protein GGF46_002485, partial [Coemansia sp. RSA 552]